MYKIILCLSLIISFTISSSEGISNINWISNNSGSWFDVNNWEEATVPIDGDEIRFGVNDNDNSVDEVDVDNFSNGVNLPNSKIRLERKITFSDASALGDPLLADDAMVFDVMQINGAGGRGIIFNVPVTAHTMSSDRHGGVFNREITVENILAESKHQDQWQINAGATKPVNYILIDENRDEDGGTVDGSFKINSDLIIKQLDFIWGSFQIGTDVSVRIDELNVSIFANQPENNNISPMVIGVNSIVLVESLTLFDVANQEMIVAENGSYGSLDNTNTEFTTPLIVGEGILIVCQQSIFANGFDSDTSGGCAAE